MLSQVHKLSREIKPQGGLAMLEAYLLPAAPMSHYCLSADKASLFYETDEISVLSLT